MSITNLETGMEEYLRKEARKFTPLPVRDNRRRGESTIPASGVSGVGAYVHLSRSATQSIGTSGAAIEWDTGGVLGAAGFNPLAVTSVTIPNEGYYDIAILAGWSSFSEGGSVSVTRTRGATTTTVWPVADDPGSWTATSGAYFEGTAPAIACEPGDTIQVIINPDDASPQTLASATVAIYLVDSGIEGSNYRLLILSDVPLAYWRLDEPSGTNAVDQMGTFDGTYQDTPTFGQDGVMNDGSGSTSVAFTGGNDRMLGSDWAAFQFSGFAPFTLEAWFNTNTVAGGSAIIIHKQVNSSGNGWELIRSGSTVFCNRVGTAQTTNVSGGTVVVGTDHYVVSTYDGTTHRIYLDSVEVDTDNSVVSMNTSTVEVAIGDDQEGSGAEFNGTIDEVAIYDRALTPAEIVEHYAMGTRG